MPLIPRHSLLEQLEKKTEGETGKLRLTWKTVMVNADDAGASRDSHLSENLLCCFHCC